MSYERCPQHNLTNCPACNPMRRPSNAPAHPTALPQGWSPEDALDAQSGQATVATQQPAEIDAATKEAMARQEAMRKGETIVIPGVTDVPAEESSSLPEQIAEDIRTINQENPHLASRPFKQGPISQEILGAADEIGKRGTKLMRDTLAPAILDEQEKDPVIHARLQHKKACERVRAAIARLGQAKAELEEATNEHQEALADRDLTREILNKAVAAL